MPKKIILLLLLLSAINLFAQDSKHSFRIRTITAGVTLQNLTDTATVISAIEFLEAARKQYVAKGYEVQTLRISTQNFYEYANATSYKDALPYLEHLDKIVKRRNVILSIGQILPADNYKEGIGDWAVQLVSRTSAISFSVPISSHEKGIHYNSIKAAAEIAIAISKVNGGEANFRFTASANCPANIPFFPAAFHEGVNSFAIGIEFPNLLNESLKDANPSTIREQLKAVLEKNFLPLQEIGESISKQSKWPYDGIDMSPAPGLDASIGQAIETYTRQPFGSPSTLSACAMLTDVLKSVDLKRCGYSGLMLPIIEDKVLAQRASEERFGWQQLLLYSAVSGTGLDVVPIPGDTPADILESIYTDVAALSLKYTAKALSVRLFLIPGKKAGDTVTFDNPYLTSCRVMKAE